MDARFRPVDTWPYESTPAQERRSRWSFKASWDTTLNQLDRELRHLDASNVVIECGLKPSEIRLDGWPRADARIPLHPGVAVHFDTPKLGHLRYATDAYETWQHNLRAIALGLEALRAVDRYGITRGGEQYRGFGELPAGIPVPAAKMSLEDAAKYLLAGCPEATTTPEKLLDDLAAGYTDGLESAYRSASKTMHPDVDGDVVLFQRLQDAKRVLESFAREGAA